ncbi:MAG: hypothetical protein IKN91_01985 [Paludibacteraceae bacterium]|nr:hypothetical protein [Paludibacteraceae bacterium]
MRKDIVTYILGAGASIREPDTNTGIPLYSNFPNELQKLIKRLESYHANELIQELEWLCNICPKKDNTSKDDFNNVLKISTIDEYALSIHKKTISVEDHQKQLLRLKNALTIAFVLWQNESNIDKRYEDFIRQITYRDYSSTIADYLFKDNIRIISWNYDVQLELAYTKVFPREEKYEIDYYYRNIFNVICKTYFGALMPNDIRSVDNYKGFVYAKMNGIALPIHNIPYPNRFNLT